MLNRVILIGRLVRDPELRYTPNGVAVANFTLAVDRPYVNQQGERETDFIRISLWRRLAETCASHLGKGRLVAVEGRLQVRTYETSDGQRRQVTEVVADDVRFLDWPKDRAASTGVEEIGDFPDLSDLGTEVELGEDDLPF
ncbi:single-strand binding protein [Thermanaeromonas toyohensis ToBE]|uniref:Single-stranded DNA-binding protein n=1 Tax=Thermanaeromonas toyohensis ToBE TaxID=698762 RepID=A0A1W1W330_9FIRM|nr:single-stranded DNA-binding protein [Thermanaeromonas toyohensis]SMC00028.1 single-strand binding protein [Thermanaeromonas toyohensis ToBE]